MHVLVRLTKMGFAPAQKPPLIKKNTNASKEVSQAIVPPKY